MLWFDCCASPIYYSVVIEFVKIEMKFKDNCFLCEKLINQAVDLLHVVSSLSIYSCCGGPIEGLL